ncbi:hypothetical protein QTH90_18005 [Variovorax sp. J2P1-59]|uniref:hypothetical protein n=1 Tax=Variovorax flavidus TaxID=3053501 RepID=UPI002575FB55|nr:hypothetical protein [Variovorax sp. J2P1-59]MDM0076308.1 hypothetical protein [Variovorax sp. J2P1-59]
MIMRNATQDGSSSHCASVECRVSAPEALAFLADGVQLGHWALGCWQTEPVGAGVVRGHSLFDDQPGYVRPVMDEALMKVVYHVGASPDALSPRISAVVEPVAATDGAGESCRISLLATRTPDMDNARWLRLMHCHEVEVLLIQARLQLRTASPRPTPPASSLKPR